MNTRINMRKFYLFYIKPEGTLYAYTSNKKYMRQFVQVRNPDKFIMKKVKLDEVETNNLYQSQMYEILEEFHGQTYLNNKMAEFTMVLTKSEVNRVISEASIASSDMLTRVAIVPTQIINEKYLESLRTLLYPFVRESINWMGNEFSRKAMSRIHVDYMKVILSEFKDTFK